MTTENTKGKADKISSGPASGSLPPVVEFRADDWRDLCIIMRSLTWGNPDASRAWFRIYERVEARRKENDKLSGPAERTPMGKEITPYWRPISDQLCDGGC